MARRRRRKIDRLTLRGAPVVSFVPVAGILAGLYLLASYPEVIALILLALITGAGTLWGFRRWRERHTEERVSTETNAMRAKLEAEMAHHRAAIVSEYRKSRSKDAFGNLDERTWRKVMDDFLWKTVFPEKNFRNSALAAEFIERVKAFAATADKEDRLSNPLAAAPAEKLDPDEYERVCGALLQARGWTVRQTPRTRDSGADLIAEKRPLRLIVQCKRYGKPVGNRAVQEVHAARTLYTGSLACVVAPHGFTAQAKKEATGLRVELLHHGELQAYAERMEAQFGGETPRTAADMRGARA